MLTLPRQTDEGSEEAIGLAVSLERIAAFSKLVLFLYLMVIISSHAPVLHRVMDLSRWNLAGQMADLLELVVQGGLTDRVSPSSSIPQQLTYHLFLCYRLCAHF